MAASDYQTFGEVRARLDEIVVAVRDKNLSLEKSLDLYEEAIELGNRCAELVDRPDYTADEAAAAHEVLEQELRGDAMDESLVRIPAPAQADAIAEGNKQEPK